MTYNSEYYKQYYQNKRARLLELNRLHYQRQYNAKYRAKNSMVKRCETCKIEFKNTVIAKKHSELLGHKIIFSHRKNDNSSAL